MIFFFILVIIGIIFCLRIWQSALQIKETGLVNICEQKSNVGGCLSTEARPAPFFPIFFLLLGDFCLIKGQCYFQKYVGGCGERGGQR